MDALDVASTHNPNDCDALHGFDFARFSVLARSLQILLGRGRVANAITAVRQFAAATRREPIDYGTHLADAIPLKIANAIETHLQVSTVGAFLKLPNHAICAIKGVGDNAVRCRDQLRDELATGRPRPLLIDGEEELFFEFAPGTPLLQFACEPPAAKPSPQPQGPAMTEREITVIEALKVLSAKAGEALAELDSKILEHQKAIAQLKQMRKMLAQKSAPGNLVADAMAKAMQADRGYKATELGALLGYHFVAIGRAARSDRRFRVTNKMIFLA